MLRSQHFQNSLCKGNRRTATPNKDDQASCRKSCFRESCPRLCQSYFWGFLFHNTTKSYWLPALNRKWLTQFSYWNQWHNYICKAQKVVECSPSRPFGNSYLFNQHNRCLLVSFLLPPTPPLPRKMRQQMPAMLRSVEGGGDQKRKSNGC